MKIYRVDEYLGAVNECKAIFFDKRDVEEYKKSYLYPDNLGIVEVEIDNEDYNAFFENGIGGHE